MAAAPWRESFLAHVATIPRATFTLATLHPAPSDEAPSAALPALPRARTCVFRGLWGTLPARGGHNNNPAPRNPPAVYESDLPVFTTDARSDKLAAVFDTAGGRALEASVSSSSGGGSSGGGGGGGRGPQSGATTGGGGPVEACFWAEAAATQWRIRGRAWALAPADADSDDEGPRMVREVLLARMRRRGGAGEADGWSFAREVTAHLGNLSPLMRGSFRAPAPGTPVAYPPGQGEGLGQRLDDVDDEMARRNFRVVVIVPEEVDQVDLSDELRPRRWLYVYRGEGGQSKLAGGEMIGEWEKVELWP